MNMNGKEIKRAAPIDRSYWICQLAGWTTFFLFAAAEAWALAFRSNLSPRLSRVIGADALFCSGGLVVTHLLYLRMRSGQWLRMPLRALWPRISAGVALAGWLLAGLVVLLNSLLLHTLPVRDLVRPRYLFVLWVSYSSVIVFWMALYLAIHEFRHRRITEVQTLRLELVAQEAQLRGLRAQINPHFLFNCLNSLRELIVENPQGAQMMVTQLSGLLRYSLQSNHAELVRLADEVQAVKDYLDLEGVRLEERLQVHWNISSDLGNVPIPPMLLQTLVENALKHGISRRSDGGEITIGVRCRDSVVELEVVNTGELTGNPSPEGIGLRNAQERLQLLYGDKATIVLERAPNNHVRAAITVPRQGAGVSR